MHKVQPTVDFLESARVKRWKRDLDTRQERHAEMSEVFKLAANAFKENMAAEKRRAEEEESRARDKRQNRQGASEA